MSDQPDNFADISILPRSLSLTDEADEAREQRELLVARAGARLFGVYADEAASVTDWREPTPLPHAPHAIMGVVCVRGHMLTVLDPLALVSTRAGETSAPRFLVALRGDEQLALAVEKTERILEIFIDEVEPVEHAEGVLHGIIQRGADMIAVLNVQEIFAAAMHGAERRRQRT